MRYFVAIPRAFGVHSEEFGVWDIEKDENGLYRIFDTVKEAQYYAKTLEFVEYYVISING